MKRFGKWSLLSLVPLAAQGCTGSGPNSGRLEKTWGRRGNTDGRLQKPRAMAIDGQDQIYIVDMTGRIQVFSRDGEFIHHWKSPDITNGKPSGLTFDREGNLLVADTHYFQVLTYTPQGEMLSDRTIGGTCGHGPGEFNFVTDAVQDSRGNYFVAEYGEYDRIQKFSPDRQFVMQFGSHGNDVGSFVRPNSITIDDRDFIWVADSCNHRIQVFDATGEKAKLVDVWGVQGTQPGEMRYPYDLVLDGKGHLYLCEFGNHRVQKFTVGGEFIGSWGVPGRREGELHSPWALVLDSRRRIHVLDTYNHRVQRILL